METTEAQRNIFQNYMKLSFEKSNEEERTKLYYFLQGYLEGMGMAYGIVGNTTKDSEPFGRGE